MCEGRRDSEVDGEREMIAEIEEGEIGTMRARWDTNGRVGVIGNDVD